jgi:hypothetical protein
MQPLVVAARSRVLLICYQLVKFQLLLGGGFEDEHQGVNCREGSRLRLILFVSCIGVHTAAQFAPVIAVDSFDNPCPAEQAGLPGWRSTADI